MIPNKLKKQHVVVRVDNIACIFGWENRSVNGDATASVLLRALHLISAFLECVVHFQHLPRMSSWDAELADRLSREATTTKHDLRLRRSFPEFPLPKSFQNWLENPNEDFSLAETLICEIEMLCAE